MMKVNNLVLTALLFSLTAVSYAKEEAKKQEPKKVVTIETTIKGSPEQPKVTTLVSWQGPPASKGLYVPFEHELPGNLFKVLSRQKIQLMTRSKKE